MMKKKENISKTKRVSIFNFKEQTHIKTKVLTLMLVSVIAVVLVTACVAIGMAYRTNIQSIDTFMEESAGIAANYVKSTINANLKTVEEFASRAYFIQDEKSDDAIQNYCEEFAERQGYLQVTYADSEGVSITGNDITDRDYFQACKSSKTSVISDLILSKASNDMVVVLAAPILKDGSFDGIIIVQAEAGFLSGLTDSITVGKTGTSYMLDSKGNAIAHPNREYVLNSYNCKEEAKSDKSLDTLAGVQDKMIAGESGFAVYSYQGEQKMLGYAPVGINGWSIGLAGGVSEFMGGLYLAIVLIIVIVIASLIIVLAVGTKVIQKMTAPLQSCAERIVLLGKGDLKTEFPKISTHDEIGVMANASEEMMDSMKEMISDMDYLLGEMAKGNFNVDSRKEQSYRGDFSSLLSSISLLKEKLCDTLRQIDQASDQVAMGSEQMAQSAQNLAEGATEQAGAVEELTATIEDVTSMAEKSAGQAGSAYRQAAEFTEQAEQSSQELRELIQAMESISDTSQKIENIIADIEDIASQTNLLSLNASIEAARAGEAGKGFAVVADQIGKLASDSAQSAVNTRELIGKSIEEINNGNRITSQTAKALEKVIAGIALLAEASKETSDMSASQAKTMIEIKKGVEEISGVIQTNSASAQESSATSEELSAQSENLKNLVSQFELKRA